jgi:hypothetical protein
LRAEVTRVWEATAAMEASRVAVVLATETSAQESVVAQDSTVINARDAEDRNALVEREAHERVSRVEAENTAALACVMKMQKALSRRSPSSRVSLRRHAGLERCPSSLLVAYLTLRPMSSSNRRCPRKSVGSSLRSSPYCRLEAPRCALPLLVIHR